MNGSLSSLAFSLHPFDNKSFKLPKEMTYCRDSVVLLSAADIFGGNG